MHLCFYIFYKHNSVCNYLCLCACVLLRCVCVHISWMCFLTRTSAKLLQGELVQSAVCAVFCVLCVVYCAVCNVLCGVLDVLCAVYVLCVLCSALCAVCSMCCVLCACCALRCVLCCALCAVRCVRARAIVVSSSVAAWAARTQQLWAWKFKKILKGLNRSSSASRSGSGRVVGEQVGTKCGAPRMFKCWVSLWTMSIYWQSNRQQAMKAFMCIESGSSNCPDRLAMAWHRSHLGCPTLQIMHFSNIVQNAFAPPPPPFEHWVDFLHCYKIGQYKA